MIWQGLGGAYGDDLQNGEEDGCRRHGRWELQHGRDIGSYLGRGDHPVKCIVARAASDGLESHEEHSTEIGNAKYSTLYSLSFRVGAASPNENLRTVRAGFEG